MLADVGKCSRSGEPVRQDFLSLFLHASSAPLAHFTDPSSAFLPRLSLTFLIVWFSVVNVFGFSFHAYTRSPYFLRAPPSPSYTLDCLNAFFLILLCSDAKKARKSKKEWVKVRAHAICFIKWQVFILKFESLRQKVLKSTPVVFTSFLEIPFLLNPESSKDAHCKSIYFGFQSWIYSFISKTLIKNINISG